MKTLTTLRSLFTAHCSLFSSTTIPLANATYGLALPDGLDGLDPMANAVALVDSGDGWLEAPYAEVENEHEGKKVLQRLTRPAAEQMVSLFNSWRGKLARMFGGVPFYIGHPDHPAFANSDTDKRSYGWIKELAAGENGLRLRIEWGDAGVALLANKHFKWWSPNFLCRKTSETSGGLPVYEPAWLRSAGLTNTPRWPVVPLANADAHAGTSATPSASQTTTTTTETTTMNLLQRLLALIGGDTAKTEDDVVGFVQNLIDSAKATLAATKARWDAESAAQACDCAMPNSAPAEVLSALLKRLDDKSAAVKTEHATLVNSLAAAETGRQEAQAALIAFRTAAAEPLVALAVAGGRVLPSKRDEALASLVNAATPEAFTAAAAELAARTPVMKVAATAGSDRRRDTDVRARQDQILSLVNSRMTSKSEDYDTAFAAVRKENAALFQETPQT